jgi:cation transport ATPase
LRTATKNKNTKAKEIMSNSKPIPSTPAGPDTEKWYEHQQQEQKDTPKRLEEAAKVLVGIISITLAIFLSDTKNIYGANVSCTVQTALALWLLSLIAAFIVVFPLPYRYTRGSIPAYQKSHQRAITLKYTLLILAALLFIATMALLVWEVFICT